MPGRLSLPDARLAPRHPPRMLRAVLVLLAVLSGASPSVAARLRLVASTTDLASIAASIGGDRVEVSAIVKPIANPHTVEILPSHLVQVSRAAIYLEAGMGLDGWARQLVEGGRNPKLRVVDCSRGVRVLDKPQGTVDASRGDLHAEGNPHYWLDPENGIIVARAVQAALASADPAGAQVYGANLQAFERGTRERLARWKADLAPSSGLPLLGFHGSWVYFAQAFGLRFAGSLEPYPGIPPSGKHLAALVARVRAEKIALILHEPYYSEASARFLAGKTGIRIVRLAPSCAGVRAGDWWSHLDGLVAAVRGR